MDTCSDIACPCHKYSLSFFLLNEEMEEDRILQLDLSGTIEAHSKGHLEFAVEFIHSLKPPEQQILIDTFYDHRELLYDKDAIATLAPKIDVQRISEGYSISYASIFPATRTLFFENGKDTFFAIDSYIPRDNTPMVILDLKDMKDSRPMKIDLNFKTGETGRLYKSESSEHEPSYLVSLLRSKVGSSLFETRATRMQQVYLKALNSLPPTPTTSLKAPGRNDPCPCGSGKKYKKCCLGKEPGRS